MKENLSKECSIYHLQGLLYKKKNSGVKNDTICNSSRIFLIMTTVVKTRIELLSFGGNVDTLQKKEVYA